MTTGLDTSIVKNLTIQKRFRKISLCDVDFFNLAATQATTMVEDYPMEWFINGNLQFTGKIKKVDKEDNKLIWHVHAEDAGTILRDKTVLTDRVWHNTFVDTIIEAIIAECPGWEVRYGNGDVDDLTELDGYDADSLHVYPQMWYHLTPGSALSHLSNICNLAGIEWAIDRTTTGTISPTYGNYLFRIASHIGNKTTTGTYVNNSNCINLLIKKNTDKVYTSVQAVGTSPEAARMVSTATADTVVSSKLSKSETTLAVNSLTSSSTIIVLNDTRGFIAPLTFNVEGEQIYCTASDSGGNYYTTSTYRGYNSTTATWHPVGADVMNMTKLYYSPDISGNLSSTGIVWVGMEPITYTGKGTGYISGLTRPASYPHHTGAIIKQQVATPETNSYASLNGIRQISVDALGAIDQDSVDLRAAAVLARTATATYFGSFFLADSDMWKDIKIGDKITVTQLADWVTSSTSFASRLPDGSTHAITVPVKYRDTAVTPIDTRVVGITWSQYKPVKIEFGDVDEYILDDFANASKAYNNANIKNQNMIPAVVTAVDANCPALVTTSASDANGNAITAMFR